MLNDALFKAWFRSEEARGVVSSFLSELTGIEKEKFLNASYIGGELPKEKITEKGKVSDVIVKLDDYNRIIVEMNQTDTHSIFEKNSGYAFSLLSQLTKRGRRNRGRVILVNIDGFNRFKTKKAILNFKLRDEDGNIEHELYRSIHIVIENGVKSEYNEIKKFCTFLQETTLEKMEEDFKNDKDYKKGIEKVKDLIYDEELGLLYDYEEALQEKMQDREDFLIEEGMQKGLEKGMQKGHEQIINALHQSGMSVEEIAKRIQMNIEDVKGYIK